MRTLPRTTQGKVQMKTTKDRMLVADIVMPDANNDWRDDFISGRMLIEWERAEMQDGLFQADIIETIYRRGDEFVVTCGKKHASRLIDTHTVNAYSHYNLLDALWACAIAHIQANELRSDAKARKRLLSTYLFSDQQSDPTNFSAVVTTILCEGGIGNGSEAPIFAETMASFNDSKYDMIERCDPKDWEKQHEAVVARTRVTLDGMKPKPRFKIGERVVHPRHGRCVVIEAPYPHPPDYQQYGVCVRCADGVPRCLLHKDLSPEQPPPTPRFSPGDRVRHVTLGFTGRVLDCRSGKIVVRGMRNDGGEGEWTFAADKFTHETAARIIPYGNTRPSSPKQFTPGMRVLHSDLGRGRVVEVSKARTIVWVNYDSGKKLGHDLVAMNKLTPIEGEGK